jgi:hypothetical protein
MVPFGMPKRSSKPKRPRDANQLGKLIVALSVGEADESVKAPADDTGKDPAAVALGRKGGLKGGAARAKALTAKHSQNPSRDPGNGRWRHGSGLGHGGHCGTYRGSGSAYSEARALQKEGSLMRTELRTMSGIVLSTLTLCSSRVVE